MSKVTQPIKTKPPIMELKTHFFPEIHVKANPNVSPEDIESGVAFDIDFITDVDVQTNDELPNDRFVSFTIKSDDSVNNKAWNIDITVVGQFRYPDHCSDETRTHLAYVTGQSILYGFVREMLHTLTLKGPFEAVYLPTITFVPDDQDSQKKPTPKKRPKEKLPKK